MMDNDDRIRITPDDLDRVSLPQAVTAGQSQSDGSIAAEKEEAGIAPAADSSSIFMKGWFQLGLAGMAGTLLGWMICHPSFGDGRTLANAIVVPLMVILMSVGFAVAEAIADRSPKKAIQRGLIAFGLATVLGSISLGGSIIIFNISLKLIGGTGSRVSYWIAHGIAQMIFGAGAGVVYGIIGQSGKRCAYGVLGGAIGAGLGGLFFDPIFFLVGHAGASLAVGFCLFGGITGVAIGLVENALKDRWLYVSAGPLSGKQFILYKPMSSIGSSNSCDLYLFKDAAIQPQHALVELRGTRTVLCPRGEVTVNGRHGGETVLKSGDHIQIGRYGFHYRDRQRMSE